MEEISLLRHGFAGFDVVEVGEEAVVVGQRVAVEAERAAYLFEDLRVQAGSLRWSAMQSAVRPKPVAAMLAMRRESSAPVLLTHLARSSTWPVVGLACSAKKRQARRSRSSRKRFVRRR